MGTPPEPSSLLRRVRRLELMLFSALLAIDDEEDESLWFEFRNLFRRGRDRDFLDDPQFDFLLSRLSRSRGRQVVPEKLLEEVSELKGVSSRVQYLVETQQDQMEALQNRFEELLEQFEVLNSKTNTAQIETHSLLAIQALGLPTEKIQSIRYVPVRAYIDKTPPGAIGLISDAIAEVLAAYGFSVADEFPEIKGSWFKKWFAKSKEVLSQPEVLERLEKIERAVEIKAIDKPQSEIDEKQASAIAKLVKALDKVPNAAVQAGSVLVVKLDTPKGPVIQARTLSQGEMVELENNQLLLQDPSEVLKKLTAACNQAKRLPPAKTIREDA
jgi:predicted metal-dependent hydrolase